MRNSHDINNFWMGHLPETMSELYFRMEFELERRLNEAKSMGVGFNVPIAPACSEVSEELDVELVLQV